MSLKAIIKLTQNSGFDLEVDISIPSHGYTAIYGPSGSGKTTLLRCIAGLDSSEAGSVIQFKQQHWQRGENITPCHKRGIGFVFQDARLMPHLNVTGNLKYALKRRHSNTGPDWEHVCQWLDLFPLLNKASSELSAGQQQRVAIGRALLGSPQLLIMDEPLASLDQASKGQVLNYLETLHTHLDIPVLYVSHDLSEVTQLADQLVVLDQGKVSAQGTTLDLCSQLQLGLAHEEQAAAIMAGTVISHDNNYQLSEINIGGQSLTLSRVDMAPGDNIRVRIPARDVSIALQQPENSSILNIIPCRIDSIEPSADSRVLVRLQTGTQFFLSRLTRKSIDRLQLSINDNVYAQIKSVALLTDRPTEHHD